MVPPHLPGFLFLDRGAEKDHPPPDSPPARSTDHGTDGYPVLVENTQSHRPAGKALGVDIRTIDWIEYKGVRSTLAEWSERFLADDVRRGGKSSSITEMIRFEIARSVSVITEPSFL